MGYKLTASKGITRLSNGASLPARWENGALIELDPDSPFVKELRDWIAAGNTPEPADVPSAAEVILGDILALENQYKITHRFTRESTGVMVTALQTIAAKVNALDAEIAALVARPVAPIPTFKPPPYGAQLVAAVDAQIVTLREQI